MTMPEAKLSIVMVLTSPRAYTFNCVRNKKKNSQYLFLCTEIKEQNCKFVISFNCDFYARNTSRAQLRLTVTAQLFSGHS